MMEQYYGINYNLNESNKLSEIFSEPVFTSLPEWREPVFTDAYTFDNKPNFIWINPGLKEFIRRKLRRKKNRKNFLYHYLYVCSTIYFLKVIDRRYENVEYVPLNYEILSRIISERKYTEIMNDLQEWGIIESNGSYQTGKRSTGYKLLNPYNQGFKYKKINDSLMDKKLNEFKQKSFRELKDLPLAYKYLAVTNTWIEMDYESAYDYNIKYHLNDPTTDKYDSNYYSISAYRDKDYRFNVDKFGNRAHTNLTNLASSLRTFTYVDAQPLGHIDVSNSQPLFFYIHIKDNPTIQEHEKEGYKRLVENGMFYEFFMNEMEIDCSERQKTKKLIIANVFYDKLRPTESGYMTVFRKRFPSIAAYLTNIRRRDNKRLAQILQKAESKFIIENVVAEFINRNGHQWEFISTIHDSIVVKANKLPEAEQIMRDCFLSEGLNPKLKQEEYW